MITALIDTNHANDDEIEKLKRQIKEVDLLKTERDTTLTEVEGVKVESSAWESKYQEEVQRSEIVAQKATNDWQASPAFLAATSEYVSEHEDVLFIGRLLSTPSLNILTWILFV